MILEELTLPSLGLPYNGKVGSKVKLRPFTTREYKDLIVSPSTVSVNALIDKCLQECEVKAVDFCTADKLAILFKIRSITMHSKMESLNTCPFCETRNKIEWDINDLKVKYLSNEEYPFKVTLPESKEELQLILPTDALEEKAKDVATKRSSMYNVDFNELFTLYKTCVLIKKQSQNELTSKGEWYERLSIKDAMYIDAVIDSFNDFGIDPYEIIECTHCKNSFRAILSTGDSLFRPNIENARILKTVAGTLESGVKATTITE